jgi:hypothetical protein
MHLLLFAARRGRRDPPACPLQRLPDRRDRADAEHAGLDGTHAIGDEAGGGLEPVLVGIAALGHQHGRRTAVQARGVPGGDSAVLPEVSARESTARPATTSTTM